MEGSSAMSADWIQQTLARYEQPLVRYAWSITGDLERARDVVQDTFLRLCQADRSRVEERLAAWLYTVCRNRALDVREKEGRMVTARAVPDDAVASRRAGPAEHAVRNEARSAVFDALQGLPADQQEAFCLKFRDQLTYREIAQVMGTSLGTVSNLVTAALAAVRQQLRDDGHLAQEG